jgi:hypothetical protein
MNAERIIELWKAIHGGCWPGPHPDVKLSVAVNEVIAGLALYNLAHGFAGTKVATQVRQLAVESLKASLPAVQEHLR